ncbi:MAG: hypothetical protein V7681_15445 [Halopseudomonas sabulinigri]
MAVRLEFLTTNPDQIALATRYWAMNKEGAFLEKVKDLIPSQEKVLPSLVRLLVQQYCIAYDQNHICTSCGFELLVTKRTEPKKKFRVSKCPCTKCVESEELVELEKKIAERVRLRRRLRKHNQKIKLIKITYDDIPDDACFILKALDTLISPRLDSGTFDMRDVELMAPYEPMLYLRYLYGAGIILDDPVDASCAAYRIKDENLMINLIRAQFCLPPDRDGGKGKGSFKKITDRVFTNAQALQELWFEYASSDVVRYLLDQSKLCALALSQEIISKVQRATKVGLVFLSVSQLWFLIWVAVKNAAKLACGAHYSGAKAAAKIPGDFRAQIEKYKRNGSFIRFLNRPEQHVPGALGVAFATVFEIDEYTSGAEVLKKISILSAV